MPKIQWNDLPPALRDHLLDRARERKIEIEDLYKLKLWNRILTRQTVLDSRISGRSRFAVKASIPRRFFFEVSLLPE